MKHETSISSEAQLNPSCSGKIPSAGASVELLAPAGNWECARAAVENGADAIYFGLNAGFNARARADNFHVSELPQLMDMLHRQGVRGYVPLNTLVFTDELPIVEENVRRLAAAGVDAVLVQDLGLARLVREICPDLVLHASTQMTLTNAPAIECVRELGIQRVVLAREMSITEIKQIRASTDLPLEAFVHGALCVAYSGQCLTSESLGGRSANRGQCAQACRLPYELICDGKDVDLGDVKYLLSPQDLAALDLVPQLLEAGISSFKIEGRLKTPEYVANACQHYRAAIDAALTQREVLFDKTRREELELSFSRGFSPGWLEGCDHKRLVPGLSSAKRGVELGVVNSVRGDMITAELTTSLATGDGIVVEGDRFAGSEIGGRVFELFQHGKRLDNVEGGMTEIGLQRGLLADTQIAVGTRLFKTDDPKLTKRLRKSFENVDPQKRVPIRILVEVAVGRPIKVSAQIIAHQSSDCGQKRIVEVAMASEHVPEVARKHSANVDSLREQFSRLGGTVYELAEFEATIDGTPMVPLSVLGTLRRDLITRLDEANVTLPLQCSPVGAAARMLKDLRSDLGSDIEASTSTKTRLRVLVRSLVQLQQVLDLGVRDVIADLHDIRQLSEAVAMARGVGAEIELATLRIHKPQEGGLFLALQKRECNGWLVRNLAALDFCRKNSIPFACDFSLNVTNPLTAEQYMRWGASRVTASYDLNRDQILELSEAVPEKWLEVVVHQHMPMFHMEHCVFCSVLSPGKNKSDCGRPCDRHDVKLRDRVGAEHVLHADIGCRNTLYNASAQSGAEAVKPLLALGVRQFRIELLRDSNVEDTRTLIELYQQLLHGELDGAQVWKQLSAHNRIGVTRGTMEQPRNPLAIL